MFYIFIFIVSFLVAAGLTLAVRKYALRAGIVDMPDANAAAGRKIHKQATPLLGGIAIFITYFLFLFIFAPRFLSGNLGWNHLIAFFAGAAIIIIGGVLDDKYNLRPRVQIIFPVLAIAAIVAGGVAIEKITNPFGGYVYLDSFFLIGPLLIGFWLLSMMYTTKLLDGVDGLVSGVAAIGGLVIFLFTLTTRYYQPDIAFAAILLVGAVSGFLIFNWHPAKIFLGEGGSLLLGYILGVLAIISGGKIAIALLVMGIPILDVVWTILRRLWQGKNPFRAADKKHLHHRFLAIGLSQKETVLIFYGLSLVFGLSGLFLQSRGKFLALVILLLLMAAIVIGFWLLDRRAAGVLKPSLLLHICCAPCGSYISRDRLSPRYRLTWYFCNPNLNSREEYDRRLKAVEKMAAEFKIPLIVEPYEHDSWREMIRGREQDPERGVRCQACYRDRLIKTAALAKREHFDIFGTSLMVSPYKDTAAIRGIGRELAADNGLVFLDEDFQADDGYRRSQELAKKYGIYRQKFCGCEFSSGKK